MTVHGSYNSYICPATTIQSLPPAEQQTGATDLVEVRDIGDIDKVDDGEVLDLVRDGVEGLIHRHALAVPVVPEADHDDAVFLGLDRLVDMPARGKVREEVGHLSRGIGYV